MTDLAPVCHCASHLSWWQAIDNNGLDALGFEDFSRGLRAVCVFDSSIVCSRECAFGWACVVTVGREDG